MPPGDELREEPECFTCYDNGLVCGCPGGPCTRVFCTNMAQCPDCRVNADDLLPPPTPEDESLGRTVQYAAAATTGRLHANSVYQAAEADARELERELAQRAEQLREQAQRHVRDRATAEQVRASRDPPFTLERAPYLSFDALSSLPVRQVAEATATEFHQEATAFVGGPESVAQDLLQLRVALSRIGCGTFTVEVDLAHTTQWKASGYVPIGVSAESVLDRLRALGAHAAETQYARGAGTSTWNAEGWQQRARAAPSQELYDTASRLDLQRSDVAAVAARIAGVDLATEPDYTSVQVVPAPTPYTQRDTHAARHSPGKRTLLNIVFCTEAGMAFARALAGVPNTVLHVCTLSREGALRLTVSTPRGGVNYNIPLGFPKVLLESVGAPPPYPIVGHRHLLRVAADVFASLELQRTVWPAHPELRVPDAEEAPPAVGRAAQVAARRARTRKAPGEPEGDV